MKTASAFAALLLGVADLGLEDFADDFGVAAVDDQLDALAHELVVQRRGLVLERQQTLAAGLLGKRDQGRDDVPLVVVDLDERGLEAPEEAPYEDAHRERGQGSAERPEEDQDDRFVAPENDARVGTADVPGKENSSEADEQANNGREVQRSISEGKVSLEYRPGG